MIINKYYSWGTGFIYFKCERYIKTRWGDGTYSRIDDNIVCAKWNNYSHIIIFDDTYENYKSIRTNPLDLMYTTGKLIISNLNIYGDSHALLSFMNMKIPHQNLFELSRTMYGIGRSNKIINFNSNHLSPDRIFCFVYGEVDARGHVGKQVILGRNHVDICTDLVDAYFKTIHNNITEYKAIIVVAITPPTDQADHDRENHIHEMPIPFVGTNSERVIYTDILNNLIEDRCKRYNYYYFNPYSIYKRNDGCLNYSLSDKCLHVGDNKHVLDEFQKLYDTIQQSKK